MADAAAKRRGKADLKCTKAESALAIRFLPSLHAAARLRRSGEVGSPGADVGSVCPVPAQMWQGARSPGGDVVWAGGSPVPMPMCAGERPGSPAAKHGIRPHSQTIVAAVDSLMSFGTNLLAQCWRPDGCVQCACAVQCSAVQCQACALTRTAARVCAERARPSPNSFRAEHTDHTDHWLRCALWAHACDRPLRVGPPGLLGNREAT